MFRRDFLQVGNIEVFQESVTIASACNKVLRKLFLKPDTIGLIPTSGYSGKINYSKKVLMWLIYREQTDGCRITNGRNGREYRLPEQPRVRVDGFCEENKTVYEFCGCYWHGHTCLPFLDVTTAACDTLVVRYETTMARLQQITQAWYQIEVLFECDFDEGVLASHAELKTHPIVQHGPLNTGDALYGGGTGATRLHYKIEDGEIIQYIDVMSLYPFVCKYFKFPIGHTVFRVGDALQDMEAMFRKDGQIKCSILPPRHLYHPILPLRCNNILLSCLCRTCALEQI